MAIINSEETASGPHVNLLELGLNNVQDNTDAIFIIIADHALVGVRRIGYNDSVFFTGKLRWVVLRLEFCYLLILHLHVLFPLLNCHFHASVVHNPAEFIIVRGLLVQDSHLRLLIFQTFDKVGNSLGRAFILTHFNYAFF